MTVQIVRDEKKTIEGQEYRYLELATEKVSAFVTFMPWGVQVCCKNSSHKVWRGAGRLFNSIQDAIEGYKSADMRSILTTAANL